MSKQPITEDDNPKWEQLRFTASILALCFNPERTIQRSMLEEMATNINSIMDRDHNRANNVLATLDLQQGKNVSQAEVQAELFVRMMDAGDVFQQAIVAYLEYAPTEGKPAVEQFAAQLAEMGCAGPSTAPPFREPRNKSQVGRKKRPWRRNAPLFARLVNTVLSDSGCSDDLSVGTADSAIAEIGAAIVSRAYGIMVDADSFSEAVRHTHRDRRKNPDKNPQRFRQLQRARIID
jgi:hypothetical protein